jgi:hypothetical protein
LTVVEESKYGSLYQRWYAFLTPTNRKKEAMPNWCYNYMTVIGSKRELKRFLADITVAHVMSDETQPRVVAEYELNKLVPLDPRGSAIRTHVHKNDEGEEVTTVMSVFASLETDGFDGYANALQTWGSKWGACRVEIDDPEVNKNQLSLRYETAWSPADGLILAISALYPSLIFGVSSDEESRAFVLWAVYHNGVTIESGHRDPNRQTPELHKLCEKAHAEGATDDMLHEWYEAESEWNNFLMEQCDDDMTTCMSEYKKHLSYVRRCEKEGRTPRTFISSI